MTTAGLFAPPEIPLLIVILGIVLMLSLCR